MATSMSRVGRFVTLALLLLVALVQLQAVAASRTYTVSWNYPYYQNYFTNWNKGNNYQVGDQIEFVYNAEAHDVAEVNENDYYGCSSSALAHSNGVTVFPLQKTGMYYFICTIPGHCQAGMRLAVNVI